MSTLKLRSRQQDGFTLVHVLIEHPMETGRRRDETTGALVPAHFIEQVRFEHNGQRVATCALSTAVSQNPYLSIRFRGGKSGDKIRVSWSDNQGQHDSAETTVA
ncbi:sulfur-oxidizing protein SoxZ [Methylomagnum ishizawai]|uniref:Sulfur-oxidizing protein SoxZ n=1 Tax=Methylomagnum ishizawai TaxID=1760988 RepID=A0A1Y6D4Z3_9GAMM|nr:thiosulfate oxidation carrier complex protein SoxZ [Methylomagnum ishizawai]SMF95933.1 sulfur-oxidizing protein SoxZ [Methylomagnum ishizawai]